MSLVLLLFFLGANWTTIYLSIEERHPDSEEAAAILGISNLGPIVDSLIALVAVALVIFLIGAIDAVRRVAKVPTIRLVSNSQPPELTISKGLTWHLFNSHIWCAAIERTRIRGPP